MKFTYWLVIALLLASASALADCTIDGRTYTEGTVFGPLTCTDGQWIKK